MKPGKPYGKSIDEMLEEDKTKKKEFKGYNKQALDKDNYFKT